MIIDKRPDVIRLRREKECFSYINRGKLWYDRLTLKQFEELEDWYQAWLDAPKTLCIPGRPVWLDDKFEKEKEEILL